MKFHLHILIEAEIKRIVKTGRTILSGSPNYALKVLSEARNNGKKYRSGCSNMKEDGMCGGHEQFDESENL